MPEPIFQSLSQHFENDAFRTVYKFMHSKYMEGFLSGHSVKFGTIHEYRNNSLPDIMPLDFTSPASLSASLETPRLSEKGGIDDPLEHRNIYFGDTANRAIFRPSNFNESVILRRNTLIASGINFPIFCLTRDLDPRTIQRMKDDSRNYSGEPYDVAIPILNVSRFGKLVDDAIRCLLGVKIGSSSIIFGSVSYIKKDDMAGGDVTSGPDPFEKDKYFETQSEFRILFTHDIPPKMNGSVVGLSRDIRQYTAEPIFI